MPSLKKYLCEDTWITTKLLWVLYLYHNIWFLIKWRNYHEFFDPWNLLVHVLGLAYIYFYCELVNKSLKNKILRTFIGITLVFTYFLLSKYRYRTHSGFDYSIVHDNFWEIFNMNAMKVAAGTLKPKDFWQALALIPILLFVQIKYSTFTSKISLNYKKSLGYFVGLLLLLIFGPMPYGEISYTAKTAYEFYFEGIPETESYKLLSEKENPFIREFKSNFEKKKPHIFVLNIESFNSLYVEKKASNGRYITPVFNELIKEGIYIDDFYGNSIQSIKGQFAFLCSQYPLIKGKASYDISLSKIKEMDCLPKVLNENGYTSNFHKCYSDLNFDDTKNFMQKIGFSHIAKTSYGLVPKEYIWGWGAQDDYSYKQFLDSAENMIKDGKRVFSVIHSVSHHMKFDSVPARESHLFDNKKPKGKKDRFANSLHATDRYIGVFFEELKKRNLYDDSIIIITGDHSYPNGEHFLYDNQTSYFQEFFKTPFLLIWKNGVQPKRIKEKTFSHVDIAPTLLDLIGVNGKFNMVGNSIFQKESYYAHLVQPYNGGYLSIVKWPYKYVWERRSKRDFLFDLSKDPHEKNNLSLLKIINEYKDQLGPLIYSHKKLYRNE